MFFFSRSLASFLAILENKAAAVAYAVQERLFGPHCLMSYFNILSTSFQVPRFLCLFLMAVSGKPA